MIVRFFGNGHLVTLLVLLGALLAGPNARAQQDSVLYDFSGGLDGTGPSTVLRDSSSGVIYGTAFVGGCGGYGTVFKVSPGGNLTTIHCFAGLLDGAVPYSGLVRDSAGTLYGTASEGGNYSVCTEYGCGVVFKVNPDPPFDFTLLHIFTGETNDGLVPNNLIIDKAGNLFGTAAGGKYGYGIVFKIDTAGAFSVLYNFTGGKDGSSPHQGLVEDAVGNLYGTTPFGGTFKAGVIFKVSGTAETVLYNFTGGVDGGFPEGFDQHLILDPSGNLYGTTFTGGTVNSICARGCGVLFEVTSSGTYVVRHRFTGLSDGSGPNASLLRTADGTIYGTAQYGGSSVTCTNSSGGCGVAYKFTQSGGLTALHDFVGGTGDGAAPNGGLVTDKSGALYGSAVAGGNGFGSGVGVIFKIP